MARVPLSTTVDLDLLTRVRAAHATLTDDSILEAALQALLREHRSAEIDEAYARAYQQRPVNTQDEWGDLEAAIRQRPVRRG
jgi:hypothetical protein